MAEFFIELFSEEIPARMQASGAAQLEGICIQALKKLNIAVKQVFYGPRRIALAAEVVNEVAASILVERGPRLSAPEQALTGFLRKHGAAKEDLVQEGEFWVLNKQTSAQPAATFITATLPPLLAGLSWPKSMRWGTNGDFTWVRPLRRVVCLLDGAVLKFNLGPVETGDVTEGHRIHGPGPFTVGSAAQWEEKLREHYVLADPQERRRVIADGINQLVGSQNLRLATDEGLLDEVTGLAEWPVALIGKIDPEFMELPPEVRELSMKINQKYFALRDERDQPAPYFAFIANLQADDGGKAIIAGNERVLRARLADARHFWELDRKTPLDALLPKLEKITFHAKIGTQRQRADRIADLAEDIATKLGANVEDIGLAAVAGLLCKADLVTGMVGEFPELQGVMGGYYAAARRGKVVGAAIGSHYQPKGPTDNVPVGIVAASVALADKLDTLRSFFAVGETPTGSGDPYALRRCALGVIRIILENNLSLPLKPLLGQNGDALFAFIIERLRVKLRGEGKRFDVLDAVLAAGEDDDLLRLNRRVEALAAMLRTEDGKNLLAAYKRAANILKIESAKDGPYEGVPVMGDLPEAAETNLRDDLERVIGEAVPAFLAGQFETAVVELSGLRARIDVFFETVTVNADVPEWRRNRLQLLARFTYAVNQIADFSRVEG